VLTKRIIACLDVDHARVVKGVQFHNLRDAGDPVECAAAHARDGADEIVLLDITATSDKRKTMLDVVSRTARCLFIPFTVGGGIRELSDAVAVVVAIDARRVNGAFEVFVAGGRIPTGRHALEWAVEAAACGAGEILLTSMDRDGTRAGFDCELVQIVSDAVSIPVIASGGAGSARDFIEVFQAGRADAAPAASIFHFGIESIAQLKRELRAANVPVRWPC
jgi:cyclase